MAVRALVAGDGLSLTEEVVEQRLRVAARRDVVAYRGDLNNSADPSLGAGMLAYNGELGYPVGSIGWAMQQLGIGGIGTADDQSYVVFRGGEDGSDVTAALQAACNTADLVGVPVLLPPWPVHFSATLFSNGLVASSHKSELVPLMPFTYGGFANQFVLLNRNFSNGYNDATANTVLYRGFGLAITPTANKSLIGLGNVRAGLVEGLRLRANRNLIGGVPARVDSLLDLYAACKNVEVRSCHMANVTGGYGATKLSEFGGACMWVRNLSSNGTVLANVTEDIKVHHNFFEHMTSDEVFAVFGVRGTTRRVQIHNNTFIGLPSIDGVYHNTFISFFPLNDGSGPTLGGTAAVYEIDFFDNTIYDGAALYDVVRIGNSADANQPCYNIRLSQNRIKSTRSTNPTTGPLAMWTALGSSGPNPETASSLYRCINGNFGAAYFRDTSGNTAESCVAENTGATCNAGFSSFQQVDNPTVLGDVYTGCSNCLQVGGGKVECAFRAFYNCRGVSGTNYRVNGSGGVVFDVDSAIADVFSMSNTRGETFGRFVRVTGSVPAGSTVAISSNVVKMTVASAYYLLENGTSSGALLTAFCNTSTGANAGIQTGVGTIVRDLNRWNGVAG